MLVILDFDGINIEVRILVYVDNQILQLVVKPIHQDNKLDITGIQVVRYIGKRFCRVFDVIEIGKSLPKGLVELFYGMAIQLFDKSIKIR